MERSVEASIYLNVSCRKASSRCVGIKIRERGTSVRNKQHSFNAESNRALRLELHLSTLYFQTASLLKHIRRQSEREAIVRALGKYTFPSVRVTILQNPQKASHLPLNPVMTVAKHARSKLKTEPPKKQGCVMNARQNNAEIEKNTVRYESRSEEKSLCIQLRSSQSCSDNYSTSGPDID